MTRFVRRCLLLSFFLSPVSDQVNAQGFPLRAHTGDADVRAHALTTCGDVDGDGIAEFLVSSPVANGPHLRPGRVTLVNGATALAMHDFRGHRAGDRFGHVVLAGQDLTGDGEEDLVIGIPGHGEGPFTNVGEVRVHRLRDGKLQWQRFGEAQGDQFGLAACFMGDCNADGFTDLLVSAPGRSELALLSGKDGSEIAAYAGPPGSVEYGVALAALGDVDGDSRIDFAVTDPYRAAQGVQRRGEVDLVSARTGQVLHTFRCTEGEGFGTVLAPAGDVDLDGVPDLLVGSPRDQITHGGEALAYSGSDGRILHRFGSALGGYGLGTAMLGLPDLNGDRHAEFAIGMPGFGPAGSVLLINGYSGRVILRLEGSSPGDRFGQALALAPDQNGDHLEELIVLAQNAAGGRGETTLFSFMGTTPRSFHFGNGCAGTGGIVPTGGTYGGAPSLTNPTFGLALSGAVGGSAGVLFIATQAFTPPIHIAGCEVHVRDPIILSFAPRMGGIPGAPGQGRCFFHVGVLPEPRLRGHDLLYQWVVIDPGATSGFVSMSRGFSLHVPL